MKIIFKYGHAIEDVSRIKIVDGFAYFYRGEWYPGKTPDYNYEANAIVLIEAEPEQRFEEEIKRVVFKVEPREEAVWLLNNMGLESPNVTIEMAKIELKARLEQKLITKEVYNEALHLLGMIGDDKSVFSSDLRRRYGIG